MIEPEIPALRICEGCGDELCSGVSFCEDCADINAALMAREDAYHARGAQMLAARHEELPDPFELGRRSGLFWKQQPRETGKMPSDDHDRISVRVIDAAIDWLDTLSSGPGIRGVGLGPGALLARDRLDDRKDRALAGWGCGPL